MALVSGGKAFHAKALLYNTGADTGFSEGEGVTARGDR